MQLSTNDIFQKQFEQFKQTNLAERLKEKYKPIPYYERYKWLRFISLLASYVFNIFSGITASVLVYFFALTITGYWIPSAIITVVFLALLEAAKRITITNIFSSFFQYRKISFGLITIALLLVGLSITFSYHGAKDTVQRFTPEVATKNIQVATASIDSQIEDVNKQIAKARETTWRGTTTTTSQRTINKLSNQLNILQAERVRIVKRIENLNDSTTLLHQSSTNLKAYHFAIITALLDLLFILTAFYLEFYDYRSFTEFATVKTNVINDSPITVNTTHTTEEGSGSEVKVLQNTDNKLIAEPKEQKQKPQVQDEREEPNDNKGKELQPTVIEINDPDAIKKAIKHVKSRIATYEYRLRNDIGTPETAQRNIDTYKKELADYQLKLQAID